MKFPLKITFRDMDSSETLEGIIRERAERLERFYDRITNCHVIVSIPHRNHHKGNLFSVHIDLLTPGGEIAISRDPQGDHSHEDMHAVLRDAFDAAARKLEDQARKRRGEIKAHAATARSPSPDELE